MKREDISPCLNGQLVGTESAKTTKKAGKVYR
jgi:hypothetical protein